MANNWELRITRTGEQTRGVKRRTVGKYEVFHDGVAGEIVCRTGNEIDHRAADGPVAGKAVGDALPPPGCTFGQTDAIHIIPATIQRFASCHA